MKSLIVVGALLWSLGANATENKLEVPPGMLQLSQSEMDRYHGGFLAPGGYELNVGLNVLTSVTPGPGEGSLSPNGTAAGGTAPPGAGLNLDMGSLVHYTSSGAEVLIQNSLSNVSLRAMTQLNIDVANYSELHGQLGVMGQMLTNSVSVLPH